MNKYVNQDWEGVWDVLQDLTVEGMSDDESLDELSTEQVLLESGRKQVDVMNKETRRLDLEWRNPILPGFFLVLEQYDRIRNQELGRPANDNTGLRRHHGLGQVNVDKRASLRGLSRSMYNQDWVNRCTLADQNVLGMQPSLKIPTLVSRLRQYHIPYLYRHFSFGLGWI